MTPTNAKADFGTSLTHCRDASIRVRTRLTIILLNWVEQLLAEAFTVYPQPSEDTTSGQLAGRAEPLLAVTVETDLKGFLIHAL